MQSPIGDKDVEPEWMPYARANLNTDPESEPPGHFNRSPFTYSEPEPIAARAGAVQSFPGPHPCFLALRYLSLSGGA